METKLANQIASVNGHAGKQDDIKLFTIQNSRGTKLTVSNCGGAVISLHVKDRQAVFADVVLGYDNPHEYLQDEYYIGTVVGRYANRTNGDVVYINDHPYKLSAKPGAIIITEEMLGLIKKFLLQKNLNILAKAVSFFNTPVLTWKKVFPGSCSWK